MKRYSITVARSADSEIRARAVGGRDRSATISRIVDIYAAVMTASTPVLPRCWWDLLCAVIDTPLHHQMVELIPLLVPRVARGDRLYQEYGVDGAALEAALLELSTAALYAVSDVVGRWSAADESDKNAVLKRHSK